MTLVEESYTANDRKLLALVHRLQRFRCYLEESTIWVVTDSQVVNHFFSKHKFCCREASWLELLTGFNITVLTLKLGKSNILDDTLSRIRRKYSQVELGDINDLETVSDDITLKKVRQ